MTTKPKHPRIQSVVEMLQGLSDVEREKLMTNLAERDPTLVDEIRKRLFTFEDLTQLPAQPIQQLLRQVPGKQLALALRKCSEEVKAHIFANMSERAAATLKEEVENLGLQKAADVERAQEEIIKIAKRLGFVKA